MRVLVTGSHGYIGSVLAPELLHGRARRHRARHVLLRGVRLRRDLAPIPTVRRDVRDVTPADLEGFDAVVHLAALSNDPIGDLNEQWTYDINLDATLARRARGKGGGRRAGSSSRRRARCTAHRGRRRPARRGRPAAPADRLRGVQGAGRGGPRRTRRRRLRRRVDAERDRLRRLAATAARHRPQQPRRLGAHDRAHPAALRRHVVAPAHPRPRSLARRRSRCSRRRTSSCAGEAFNVGSAEQNYLVRDLAGVLAEVTGCEIELAGDASPDPRSYRVDFSKLAGAFPDSRSSGTRVAAPRSSSTPIGRSAHHGALRGPALRAPPAAPPPPRRAACSRRASLAAPAHARRPCGSSRPHRGRGRRGARAPRGRAGYFARAWCRDELAAAGLDGRAGPGEHLANSTRAGTLRGHALPDAPHEEAKLVRCIRGAIFDVVRRPPSRSPRTSVARGPAGRGQRSRALRPGGVRARLPDARRRLRRLYMISPVRPGGVVGRALGRSRVRRSSGRPPRSGRSASATARGRTTGRRPPDRRGGALLEQRVAAASRSPRTAARTRRDVDKSCCRREAQQPEERSSRLEPPPTIGRGRAGRAAARRTATR